MESILSAYIEADVIVYATPLYHFGMTALLKKMMERTLPIVKPFIVKIGDHYRHPSRYEENSRKHILISTCGFPERHHFDNMVEHFNILTNRKLDENILCTGGEMLRIKEENEICQRYVSCVEKAGYEFGTEGCFSESTRRELQKNFFSVEAFVDIANLSWNVPGENTPMPEAVHGSSGCISAECIIITESKSKTKIMLDYMNGMVKRFNQEGVKWIDCILQMDFGDINESYYLKIVARQCSLHVGKSEIPTTTIMVNSDVWLDIGAGKLNGSTALMEGKYRVLGDFGIMIKFSELFNNGKNEIKTESKKDSGFLKFVSPIFWLSVLSFIPWYFFLFSCAANSPFPIFLPLGISLAFYAYRKIYIEVTPFDTGNVLFFMIMFFWQTVNPNGYIQNANLISSIGLAVIWGSTLMMKAPLTAWYSKDSYSKTISESPLFLKINQILTVFWVMIYLFQAVARILVPSSIGVWMNVVVYGILILAGFFTSRFPGKYLARINSKRY